MGKGPLADTVAVIWWRCFPRAVRILNRREHGGATLFSFSGTEEAGLKLRPKGQGRSAQQGGWRGRPREGEHPANLWAGGGDRLRVGSQGKQGRGKMSPDHRESERASR